MNKEKKQPNRLLLLAILFLGIFFLILTLKAAFFLTTVNFESMTGNPFAKNTIVAPLPKINPSAEIEKALVKKGIAFAGKPQASDSAIVAVLTDGPAVFFHSGKDAVLQVDSLQIILNKLIIEGRKAARIDFRFENPLVVY